MKNARQTFISNKISKVMHEGVRGKKVPLKQAEAIAFSAARKMTQPGRSVAQRAVKGAVIKEAVAPLVGPSIVKTAISAGARALAEKKGYR
jgi:hypothetical protein